jgi:hypothetical protein
MRRQATQHFSISPVIHQECKVGLGEIPGDLLQFKVFWWGWLFSEEDVGDGGGGGEEDF